jgi:hypothetical protein
MSNSKLARKLGSICLPTGAALTAVFCKVSDWSSMALIMSISLLASGLLFRYAKSEGKKEVRAIRELLKVRQDTRDKERLCVQDKLKEIVWESKRDEAIDCPVCEEPTIRKSLWKLLGRKGLKTECACPECYEKLLGTTPARDPLAEQAFPSWKRLIKDG